MPNFFVDKCGGLPFLFRYNYSTAILEATFYLYNFNGIISKIISKG